jgi:hypothetical protein
VANTAGGLQLRRLQELGYQHMTQRGTCQDQQASPPALITKVCMCWVHQVEGLAPGARGGHAAVAVGSKVLLFGGSDRAPVTYNDLWCLDTSKARMLQDHSAAQHNATSVELRWHTHVRLHHSAGACPWADVKGYVHLLQQVPPPCCGPASHQC